MSGKSHFILAVSFVLSTACLAISPAAAAQKLTCTLIVDETSGDVLHRDGTCDKAFAPMSTFKLPLAIMGYDADILLDATTPRWDYKPEFNGYKSQQKPTDPTIWLKDSIVWYSQELTRRLGDKRFSDYIKRFDYGNKDVSGDPGKHNGLTHAWLASSLKISPEEQVGFLRRFLRGELPVSEDALEMTKAIMPHFEAGDWDVQGKTGTGALSDAKGGKAPIGWFVGWATRDDRRVIFARLTVGAKKGEQPAGPAARDDFLKMLPNLSENF